MIKYQLGVTCFDCLCIEPNDYRIAIGSVTEIVQEKRHLMELSRRPE